MGLRDRCMIGLRGLRHVGIRHPAPAPKLWIRVDAAHQRSAVVRAGCLADIGRDVADGEADAPHIGRVGIGAMDQPDMVQRHLAGLQLQHAGLRVVDLDHDLLAAAEQVVGAEGVAMRNLVQHVAAGDHPHGAVRGGAVG